MQKKIRDLQDKMQNEAFEKLANLLDAYCERSNRKGYHPTEEELKNFHLLQEKIAFIEKCLWS